MWAVVVDLPVLDANGKPLHVHRTLDFTGDVVGALEHANRRMSGGIVATLFPLNREIEDRFPRLPCAGLVGQLLAKRPLRQADLFRCIRNRVAVN